MYFVGVSVDLVPFCFSRCSWLMSLLFQVNLIASAVRLSGSLYSSGERGENDYVNKFLLV